MTPEEIEELRELIEFLKENNIGEFDLERGDRKVRIKFGPQGPAFSMAAPLSAPPLPPAGVPPAQPAVADRPPEDGEEAGLHTVKSPIVGTFYESPSPGAAAFVKIGDEVDEGQVLCIVEAMKLMNEIESDGVGEVVKRLVSNGQPVEYGQPLFVLRPKA